VIDHRVGSREEWLAERTKLLEAEKELTRRSDELARRRQQLPWVRVDKDYDFDTESGPASLVDLFGGRSQLLVYHFMFPGCPSCASRAEAKSPDSALTCAYITRRRLRHGAQRGRLVGGRTAGSL
jgi:predicted dithiol-disulfide oxidoreductase (DUF899 family)